MTYMKAVEAGVDMIDTAISPFALGTSQPATEVMVETFKGSEYDTGLDMELLGEMIKYFRVDKLRQLKREEGKREGETAYQKLDVTDFSKKTFGMFAGEKKRLQLVFDNSLIGVAIDRFGKEIPVLKESETQFRTFVEISVSKQFYGWLAGIGKGVSIVEPKEEQEKYRKYLENIWKL